MKIILVAATSHEISPLLNHLGRKNVLSDKSFSSFKYKNLEIDVLVTGAGMVPTTFAMGSQLVTEKYAMAINAGIAGSFSREINIGNVVVVDTDYFYEWGAEDNSDFISIDSLGFGKAEWKSIETDSYAIHLERIKGITVNKAHGNEESILRVKTNINPVIESMEGAAFFYACAQRNIRSIQLRSISNYVEKRDKSKWDIPLAIKNLNAELLLLLDEIIDTAV